jgi:hypothetical protein
VNPDTIAEKLAIVGDARGRGPTHEHIFSHRDTDSGHAILAGEPISNWRSPRR